MSLPVKTEEFTENSIDEQTQTELLELHMISLTRCCQVQYRTHHSTSHRLIFMRNYQENQILASLRFKHLAA